MYNCHKSKKKVITRAGYGRRIVKKNICFFLHLKFFILFFKVLNSMDVSHTSLAQIYALKFVKCSLKKQ